MRFMVRTNAAFMRTNKKPALGRQTLGGLFIALCSAKFFQRPIPGDSYIVARFALNGNVYGYDANTVVFTISGLKNKTGTSGFQLILHIHRWILGIAGINGLLTVLAHRSMHHATGQDAPR